MPIVNQEHPKNYVYIYMYVCKSSNDLSTSKKYEYANISFISVAHTLHLFICGFHSKPAIKGKETMCMDKWQALLTMAHLAKPKKNEIRNV